ncbi:MAG: thermonuclease family protein [Alphaproteobacteria bacterium]|nr:thermonuclease family protein [Alphaproteobacteria bacterium]
MPLKISLIILCICLFPIAPYAKEVSSPCPVNNELCPNLQDALKDRPDVIALSFERVVDGDTFVAGGRMIRVWGIDAPERDDPAYRVSGWLLQSLVEGQVLNCRFISLDRYKRDVMQCRVGDLDIGSVMVKFGMARDYERYSAGYYQPEEKEAKAKKRGIWNSGKEFKASK